MQIKEVQLIRYGPFKDTILKLGAGLNLIFGPNEAGKSTSMRGVLGALFAFPQRERDTQLFPSSEIRVGMVLDGPNGPLSFQRRRGKTSLIGTDEETLRPYLAGLKPEEFAFDHKLLQEGAKSLMQGSGELGQALFAAREHGLRFQERKKDLQEAENALFRVKGKKQKINACLGRISELKQQLKAALLLPGDYGTLEEKRDQLQLRQETLGREILEKQKDLGRGRRILDRLGDIESYKELTASLNTELPVDSKETIEEWKEAEERERRIKELERRLGSGFSREILKLGDIIEDAHRLSQNLPPKESCPLPLEKLDSLKAYLEALRALPHLCQQISTDKLDQRIEDAKDQDALKKDLLRLKKEIETRGSLLSKEISGDLPQPKQLYKLREERDTLWNNIPALKQKVETIDLYTDRLIDAGRHLSALQDLEQLKATYQEKQAQLKENVEDLQELLRSRENRPHLEKFSSILTQLEALGLSCPQELSACKKMLEAVIERCEAKKLWTQLEALGELLRPYFVEGNLNFQIHELYERLKRSRERLALDEEIKELRQARVEIPKDLEARRRACRTRLEMDAIKRRVEDVEKLVHLDLEQVELDCLKLENALYELQAEKDRVLKALGSIHQELAAMDGGAAAATLSEALESEKAQLQELVDQYITIRLAREAIQEAEDSYLQEKQGPILSKASKYFSKLTCGSFEGLEADYDDDDKATLRAIRKGERLPLNNLSEGSCSQLYLALTLATLEDAPAPILLDDVLIHFDDKRASAALKLLSEIAKKKQVILFSHHSHLQNLSPKSASIIHIASPLGLNDAYP